MLDLKDLREINICVKALLIVEIQLAVPLFYLNIFIDELLKVTYIVWNIARLSVTLYINNIMVLGISSLLISMKYVIISVLSYRYLATGGGVLYGSRGFFFNCCYGWCG